MTRHGHPVSVKANPRPARVKCSGRNQNRMHTQKALLEYLLPGKVQG